MAEEERYGDVATTLLFENDPFLENLRLYLDDEPLAHRVDVEQGY